MSVALPAPAREIAERRDRVARARLADELAKPPRRGRLKLAASPEVSPADEVTAVEPSPPAPAVASQLPPLPRPRFVRPFTAAASIAELAASIYRLGEAELELELLEPAARRRAERLLAAIPAESIGRVDQACRVALELERLHASP